MQRFLILQILQILKILLAFEKADITLGGDGTATAAAPSLTNAENHIYTARITPTADGTIIVGLTLTGVEDAAGNAVTATGSTTSDTLTYDRTAPTVTVARADGGTGKINAASFHASFTFNEPVTGFDNTKIAVTNGTKSQFQSASTSVYRTTITPTNDGDVVVSVSLSGVKDTAGNAVTPTGSTTSITVGYDGTAPTVTASTPASRVNADFVVTFTFNEPLDNVTFTNSDIAITGTGTATVHSGPTKSNTDAKVYTATIRPSVAGTVSVSLKPESVTDEVGNKLTDIGSTRGITVTYDTSGPTVSLALASGYTEPVSGAFDVSFTFNEPVTGFGAADISVTNGSAAAPSGSGAAYTATITPNGTGNVFLLFARR